MVYVASRILTRARTRLFPLVGNVLEAGNVGQRGIAGNGLEIEDWKLRDAGPRDLLGSFSLGSSPSERFSPRVAPFRRISQIPIPREAKRTGRAPVAVYTVKYAALLLQSRYNFHNHRAIYPIELQTSPPGAKFPGGSDD